VPPLLGGGERHHDVVPCALVDVAVTSRAAISLHRLIGLHPADLDVAEHDVPAAAGAHPMSAHSTRATAMAMAAATRT
jgi:hypothetical protein